ncbi:MAG TPA: c-type cytochrome [Burkholderiaceae bacterium]|nr:c-type cytochrome [Burkholderiaceae bacterium]
MNTTRLLAAAGFCAVVPLASAQQAPAPVGNPDAAKPYISMCTGCHTIPGYQASFPRVYHVPKIGGQSAKYIEAALEEYKKGERNHPTMKVIAQGLSDQQIADIAAYYAARGSEPAAVANK